MSELSDALRAQRIEFAGEVHDRIIPPLFAARMRLETLAARLGQATQPADIKPDGSSGSAPAAEIEAAVTLIVGAIATCRQLLSEWTPHDPPRQHWDSQLHRALGDSDIELKQVGDLPWDRIETDTAITLTSIAEEAIRNAVRHGGPSRIEMTIQRIDQQSAGDEKIGATESAETYQLAIADDGKGFDPAQATGQHGLHLMRLRAAAIGGDVEIVSQPSGPTKVLLRWRVPARRDD